MGCEGCGIRSSIQGRAAEQIEFIRSKRAIAQGGGRRWCRVSGAGALLHSWIRAEGATHYGPPRPAPGISEGQALLLEAVLTFFLVTAVVGAAVSNKGSKGFHGLAIGLTIAASWLVGGALTGAALNPALSFGPAVVALNFDSLGVYWVGPIGGGLVAALAGWIIHNLRAESETT